MEPITQTARLTTREPIVYESNGHTIFGVLHRPAIGATAVCPGVVMYHGFVAAKYQPPHRIFVQLAEALARIGIVSLRIDLPGRGDSEGDSIDITVDGDLDAAHKALDVLCEQPGIDSQRIGLVGISWGGALAATLAGRDQRVAATALWSCAPGVSLNWQPDLQEINGRMASEVVGNLIGAQFYKSLAQLKPLHDLIATRGQVLLVYGTEDEIVPYDEIERVLHQLAEHHIPHELLCIEGADHVFFNHHWQHQVVVGTTAWLQKVLC